MSEDCRKAFQGLKPFAIESIVLKREITSADQLTEGDKEKLVEYDDWQFQRMNEARRRYEALHGSF